MKGRIERIVYIDSCAFNVLFDEGVIITEEFSETNYELKTTKGVVKELEDIAIGEPIRDFSLALVNNGKIHVDSFFGFSDGENQYRHIGGFGEGKLASGSQSSFLKKTKNNLGSVKPKSGVKKNQTDRDLLAHGFGAIILTTEKVLGCKDLKQLAEIQDTKVINIAKWQKSNQTKHVTLRCYVENFLVDSIFING